MQNYENIIENSNYKWNYTMKFCEQNVYVDLTQTFPTLQKRLRR